MPRSKFVRMASAMLVLLALVLPVATVTPVFAATSVSGTVNGSDAAGASGVPGITVALVRLSDATVIAATLSGAGGTYTLGGGTAGQPGNFTDQSGSFVLVFLDNRGCGAANLATPAFPGTPPAAGAPGCPTGAAGTATAGCVAASVCGYQPSVIPITLVGGTITQSGGTVTLNPAPIPTGLGTPSATTDAAFGFVVNTQGLGVQGLTVTAIPLAGGAACGSGTAPIGLPIGAACTTAAAAASPAIALPSPVATQPATGLWVITGLTPGAAYYFELSGPGVTPGTTLTPSNAGISGGVMGCSAPPAAPGPGCTTGSAFASAGPPLGLAGSNTLPPFIVGGGAGWVMPGTNPPAVGGKWVNAGTFAISQAISSPAGRGFVTGQVNKSDGTPDPNVNVVLTDATGQTYATTTNGAGAFIFTGLAQNGQGVFAGTAKLVIADNDNDYGAPSGFAAGSPAQCPPAAACGFFPAANTSIAVTAGVTTNAGTFTLANKISPASGAEGIPALGTTAGTFGYAVNSSGQGIGGLTVTAYVGTFPTGTGLPAPAPVAAGFTNPVVTDAQTGRWRMGGLVPGTTYTFVLSGPGVSPPGGAAATVSCLAPVPANAGGTTTCTDVITMPAGGLWADPVFVVAIASPGTTIQPLAGTGTITGQVIDSQGLPGANMTAVLWSVQTRQIVPNPLSPFILAAPGLNIVGCGGNFCGTTASPNPQLVGANGQYAFTGLTPGLYTVTIIDSREASGGEFGCPAASIPLVAGGVPPVPCGSLPATQVATITADNFAVLNFQMGAKIAPGVQNAVGSAFGLCSVNITTANQTCAQAGGTPTGTGIFGYVVDMAGTGGANPAIGAVAGLQPVQGIHVYALAAFPLLSCALPAGALSNAYTCASLQGNPGALPTYNTPFLTSGGVLADAITDPSGRYQMVIPTALTAAMTAAGGGSNPPIDVAIEAPAGTNGCVAGLNPTTATPPSSQITGTSIVATSSSLSSLNGTTTLSPGPGVNVTRCTITMGSISTNATAGAIPGTSSGNGAGFSPISGTGPTPGAWNDGASFGVISQNLTSVPGGESSTRRLEAVVPFFANTPDPARLGGWDLETTEIRVANAGQARTVAELDFFATDRSE